MNTTDILKRLCAVPYLTGREAQLYKAVEDCLYDKSSLCRDNFGNIVLKTGNPSSQNKLIIDAHCDRIGFVVTDILDDGFLRLAAVGGIDNRTLFGARLISVDGGIEGVFSLVPVHLKKEGDGKSYDSLSDLALDIGFSFDETKKRVSVGDFFIYDTTAKTLCNDVFTGAGLDNLAGCAAAIDSFNRLCEKKLKNTEVTVILSCGEELGLRGARAASTEINADRAICIDVSFGAVSGAPSEKTGVMGKGVMLGVSPVLSREFLCDIEAAANEDKLPIQYEIMGEGTGTNADALSLSIGGCECALISIPIRNMHTPIETVKLSDISVCSDLIVSYAAKEDAK